MPHASMWVLYQYQVWTSPGCSLCGKGAWNSTGLSPGIDCGAGGSEGSHAGPGLGTGAGKNDGIPDAAVGADQFMAEVDRMAVGGMNGIGKGWD